MKHEEALRGQAIQDPSKGAANTGQCTAHGSYHVKESDCSRYGWSPTQTLHTHAQVLLPHT